MGVFSYLKIIRRNIKNIEMLEKLEEKERLKKERADANSVATFEPTGVNFSSVSDEWVPSFFLLRDLNIAQ